MRRARIFLAILLTASFTAVLTGSASVAVAAESKPDLVLLTNGDRLSGIVLQETSDTVTLDSGPLGTIDIRREHVKKIIRPKQAKPYEEEPETRLKREISVGYNATSGNTNQTEFVGRALIDVLNDREEWNAKVSALYGTKEKEVNSYRARGSTRYAHRIGKERRWYAFTKGEAEHNRFADLSYRLTPSVGAGYWFVENAIWKLRGEFGVGADWTQFRDTTEDRVEWVLIPGGYAQRRFGKLKISEEIYAFPSLTLSGEYRLRAETAFSYPIREGLWARFSIHNDYNSNPAAAAKKHDQRVITSIVYSF